MNDLDDFVEKAKKNSMFVKLETGTPLVCLFIGAKLVDDDFNVGEKVMQYSVEVNGDEKTFKSKSVKLAKQMQGKEGKKVSIVKTGAGSATMYSITDLDELKKE